MSYQGYPQTNQIRFTTSSPLMITSYALISVANFLLVSQHIFSTDSRIKEGTEIGLFTAALALTAINMMILLYIKSRKMPKQGISLSPYLRPLSANFGPIVFTILQIILMSILIALFVLSNTTLDTTTKVFILSAIVILNIGQILTVWGFNSTKCGSFYQTLRPNMNQGYSQGMNQVYNQQLDLYQ
jgi:hypothetical protein